MSDSINSSYQAAPRAHLQSLYPYWPRMMSEILAARYLGISPTFLRQHGPAPKRLGRRVLHDIRTLDSWADALDGQPLTEDQKSRASQGMAQRIRDRMNGQN
jgi:hypothetical protein